MNACNEESVQERTIIRAMMIQSRCHGIAGRFSPTASLRRGGIASVFISANIQKQMTVPGTIIAPVPRNPKKWKRSAPMIGPLATPSVPPVT